MRQIYIYINSTKVTFSNHVKSFVCVIWKRINKKHSYAQDLKSYCCHKEMNASNTKESYPSYSKRKGLNKNLE